MASAHRRAASRSACTHAGALLILSALSLFLGGCGNFFSCEGKASCPTTCTSTSTTTCPTNSTVDYAYIANASNGTSYTNGYDVSTGALTALTNSPFSLDFSPSALAITPSNTYLYAATDSTLNNGVGYLYGYSIGSGGAISILASGKPLVSENITSLAISPDGQWLFCLDTNGLTLEEYSINSSTGAVTFANTYGITGASTGLVTPSSIAIAPSGDFLVVALGTGGAETFSFVTSTGVATVSTLINPANASTGIYAVAVDANNYLYAAGTAGLQVFSTTTAGVPTLQKTYATGNGPRSIVINPDSTFVYVGNQTDSTITAYTIGTNAALAAVSGSPFSAPDTVSSLAIDSTGAYLVAAGYNATSGINLYAIGATGTLTSKATAATGTSTLIPTPIAMTH